MTTLLATAVSAVAVAFGGGHSSTTQYVIAHVTPVRQGKPCHRLFTVPEARRAIDVTYAHDVVTKRERLKLAMYERCQRNPMATPYVRRLDHAARAAWYQRLHPPMYQQLASWYDDTGATACGFHAYYGVANKSLPCGTKVLVRYGGHQLTMIVQDRGPYVGGRVWDLNQNTAGALGFGGVGSIWVSVPG